MMKIEEMMELALNKKASDIHLLAENPPLLRVDGVLFPIPGEMVLGPEEVKNLIFTFLGLEQQKTLQINKELDFSFAYGQKARFRTNVYYQKGTVAAALRLIPREIKTIDELGLPAIFHKFAALKQGFILITGPTGHGKSTSLAAIINEINQNRACHIITIEDPFEFVFSPKKAVISQRELFSDTHSWNAALRSALREDPDVVLVGEMRDLETISTALTIAETGHLVLATLHTNSAAQTVDRIIDVFPEESKVQVRIQLSAILEAVVSQRLLPAVKGGRVVATEIMLGTPAIKNSIREGKTHQLDGIIQTSASLGMMTLETSMANLIVEGKVSLEVAQALCLRPEELLRLVRTR